MKTSKMTSFLSSKIIRLRTRYSLRLDDAFLCWLYYPSGLCFHLRYRGFRRISKVYLPVIKCTVCPAECKSFKFYPDCDPDNPSIPWKPLPKTINLVTEDFFGQFIKKNVRVLNRQDVQRYIDRIFILCPECQRKLDNPTSDDYLICSFCNIHWDLINNRNISHNVHRVDARLRPDGFLYRRNVVEIPQLPLDLLDVPF